jgi:integrase
MRSAPQTFERLKDAERYLILVESQLIRGEWIDPERGTIRLTDYADRWIVERPGLRPRTIELYRLLLRRHISPYLGDTQVGRLTTPMIREWRSDLIGSGASKSMAAKAYRFIRAVLNTAMKEDELIRVNPCRIPGADKEHTAERPVLTLSQVFTLAELVPDRYRALVILSTFASLRWGEAIALQRRDVDLTARTVSVTKAYSELPGSVMAVGPTKSRAGVRVVSFPALAVPYLTDHLARFTGEAPESLIFTGGAGGALRRSNFRTATKWRRAVTKVGVPSLRFHDLRHTGNTLAAQTGASLRDLMTRMGHDSPRAALIYQHASADADRAIADALDAVLKALRDAEGQKPAGPSEPEEGDDGAAGALVPVA